MGKGSGDFEVSGVSAFFPVVLFASAVLPLSARRVPPAETARSALSSLTAWKRRFKRQGSGMQPTASVPGFPYLRRTAFWPPGKELKGRGREGKWFRWMQAGPSGKEERDRKSPPRRAFVTFRARETQGKGKIPLPGSLLFLRLSEQDMAREIFILPSTGRPAVPTSILLDGIVGLYP